MKRYLHFYKKLIKYKLSSDLAYTINFWAGFLTDFISSLIQIAMFSVIYNNITTINGWNLYQVYIFLGTFRIVDSIRMTIYFFGVYRFPRKIKNGDLDIYIVKPVNTLLYLSLEQFDIGSIFNFFVGLAIVIYGYINLNLSLSLFNIVGYILLVLIMVILLYNLMLLFRVFAFWLIKIDSLAELEGTLTDFAYKIPGVAYKGSVKVLLYYILPYGLIATIPSQFLTNTMDGYQWVVIPLILCFFIFINTRLWKAGMKRYTSASS